MSTVYFLAVSYKLLPEQGNTLAKVVCCTINFDGLATVCLFCWEAEMVSQLVKGYTKSAHPLQTMRTHNRQPQKSTQDLISRVWVKLFLLSRILLQHKSRGPPENLNPFHKYTLTPSSIHTLALFPGHRRNGLATSVSSNCYFHYQSNFRT